MISNGDVTYVGGWGSPGWIVPTRGPATIAEKDLYNPAQVIQGPDLDHLWTVRSQYGGDISAVVLVDWNGHPTGPSVPVPAHLRYGSVGPDGAGYLLAQGIGGYYDLTPGGARLVTHGLVLAAGPTGFLAYECGDTPACRTVMIDRSSWSRRVLSGLTLANVDTSQPGVIAADGSRAAFLQLNFTNTAINVRLRLVDLATGSSTLVAAPIDPNTAYSWSAQFSPDGKHLAVILEGGGIGILDSSTGAVTVLGLPPSVPPMTALTSQQGG
jgi:hypothetical protein